MNARPQQWLPCIVVGADGEPQRAEHQPWPFVARGKLYGAELRRSVACLGAAERREQLQLACRTWVAAGRPRYGRELDRLTWAAGAHMQAQMAAGL